MVTSDKIIDTLDENFPQANDFLKKLRTQVSRVNTNLHRSVRFDTNVRKGVMYIRGTTTLEIYMWVLFDYIQKIPNVCLVEFAQPLFGLECIQFQFISPDNVVEPLNDQKLRECLENRLQQPNFQDDS